MFKKLAQIVTGLALIAMPFAPAGAASGGGGASFWHIGYYNASNRALSNAQALPGGVASLNFTSQDNTALLYTDNPGQYGSLLGNLSGKTVNVSVTVAGATGPFTYYGEGTPSNPCGTPASVRLFFETSNAGGFDETHYWWSNPTSAVLADGTWTLSTTFDGSNWSDYYGHFGSDSSYAAGFNAAVSNVTLMGLSFGGGCFFENGVGTTDGSGTFTINSFTVN